MTVYDFSVKTVQGDTCALSEYRGKVLLIVNTATKCGLTPQYEALEALYQTYQDRGFEILDFPCNQFMRQAPGTDEEIGQFCTLHYGTTFPRFAKIEVNGDEADPLYAWLKAQAREDTMDEGAQAFAKKIRLLHPFLPAGEIQWNFGKFLIDRSGNVAGRYAPGYTPDKLAQAIEALL
ncbi:MAG: glutathione peroxidase [Oscillospiraceae bacterium]|nr:glutathione peroxidase [Oscillospiraceae bacterium]